MFGIINYMKAVYIALMLGSMGGSIALLIHGFDRYKICLTQGIIFWTLCLFVVVLGVYAFRKASEIGRREDEISKGW